jgi:hypothetical protein
LRGSSAAKPADGEPRAVESISSSFVAEAEVAMRATGATVRSSGRDGDPRSCGAAASFASTCAGCMANDTPSAIGIGALISCFVTLPAEPTNG